MTDPSVLTAEDIAVCYRVVLGRDPESAAVVQGHLSNYVSMGACMKGLMESAEFRARLADPEILRAVAPLVSPTLGTSRVPQDLLDQMIERVRVQWTKLGEADPYWSVLSSPEFRAVHLNQERILELRNSGRREARLLTEAEARTGHPLPNGVCVELGCGVGRITRYLAERFEKVIALDISPGNLRLCAEYVAEEGLTNVETRLVSNFDDFANVPECDALFSVIVLQHNPPPVQRFILESLLSRIRPGGGALFQVATHMYGYAFDAEAFLADAHPEIEMHALPMPDVLELIGASGLSLLEATPDPFTGQLGSYTFFAKRP